MVKNVYRIKLKRFVSRPKTSGNNSVSKYSKISTLLGINLVFVLSLRVMVNDIVKKKNF